MIDKLSLGLWEWWCLSIDIHPYPCPDCYTHKLEKDSWICLECGRNRIPNG